MELIQKIIKVKEMMSLGLLGLVWWKQKSRVVAVVYW